MASLGEQDWIAVMAAYIKTLDPNHLLTVGEEGFYSHGPDAATVNPRPL